MRIDVNDFIDALPILAVVGCFAEGRTEIVNGAMARNKECDRIAAIALELKKMGAKIEEKEDGLVIEKSNLRGAIVESHEDHRIAMSLCVAALGASSPSTIYRTQCIKKTYPLFLRDFQAIGGGVE
jgi:5-enolpyruvylshikimate-3-phosphate synthase